MKRLAVVLLGLGLGTAGCQAAVFKCLGADGRAIFSDRPCPAGQRSEALPPRAPAAAPSAAAAGATAMDAAAGGAHGLTFAIGRDPAPPPGVAYLSCHGEPAALDRPHAGSCNPYAGDTTCRASLPVACIKSTGAELPAGLQRDFYKGWVRGQLGATRPVTGSALDSERAASARCEAELGSGWRMAEFHDGGGGWGLQGEQGKGIAPGTRYWVRINDQRGNCWDGAAAAEAKPLRRQ